MNYPKVKLPEKVSSPYLLKDIVLEKRVEKSLYGQSDYNICLVDDSLLLPITLDESLIKIVNKEFFPIVDPRQRSEQIFKWVCRNIKYGENKRFGKGYRNAKETFEFKEGVCGEMAYVYVILARATGIKSNYVSVKKDYRNKSVHHACAGIFEPNLILVDPAYRTFDVKHKEYEVLTDIEMLNKFKSWRNT